MHEKDSSKPVHWYNPEGWNVEEGGRGVWREGHVYNHVGFISIYGKYLNIAK